MSIPSFGATLGVFRYAVSSDSFLLLITLHHLHSPTFNVVREQVASSDVVERELLLDTNAINHYYRQKHHADAKTVGFKEQDRNFRWS